jgi:diguanylate cyclase
MEIPHSFERSTEHATRALDLMREKRIPPTPNNFTVWYCYFSNEYPELTRALDLLLNNNQEFTEQRNALVYRKFCAGPFEALPLHIVADRIEAELHVVLGALEQAGRKARDYGQTLESATGQMATAQGVDGILQIVGRLLYETRAMAMQSREIEEKLHASSCEIGKLKTDLEGARREALTDALTGIANRKMFDYVLREKSIEATETGEPLSLLLIDIDDFKAFNDEYGHVIGDQVLKLLGGVLTDNVKGQDLAARYGGEEFAVILPRTRSCDARTLADSIRQKVADKKLVNRKSGDQLRKITVSVGVAEFSPGEPLVRLIESADHALYFAKRLGRNRVIADEDVHGRAVVGA